MVQYDLVSWCYFILTESDSGQLIVRIFKYSAFSKSFLVHGQSTCHFFHKDGF